MESHGIPLLEVDHVTKVFHGVVAVSDLSFTISEGEILGLIGPNGAGKTSTFNLIAGAYKPDAGSIKLSGVEISGKKPSTVSSLGVARTFQIPKPFGRMSTLENVLVGSLFGRNGVSSIRTAKMAALSGLQEVGLKEKSEQKAADLTLAEQRRLELARAVATNPKLLMLDEIMAGLNSAEVLETLDLLARLKEERKLTLLIIEHVMLAVTKLCGRIVVMEEGKKLCEGTPEQIANDSRVIEAYMGSRGRLKDDDPKAEKSQEN